MYVRVLGVKPPLEPPYTGPHRVVTRLDEKRFVININGEDKTIAVDRLKPANLAVREENTRQQSSTNSTESAQIHENPANKNKKRVSFPLDPVQVTGGE